MLETRRVLAIGHGQKDAPSLQLGDPAIPARVVADEGRIVSSLKQAGYAFAASDAREVIGDAETATIDLVYRVNAGPRVRLGSMRFEGSGATREAYLDRLSPFVPGDLYAPDTLTELESRIGELRLYRLYSARLAPEPSGTSDDGDAVHDVIITLTERRRYTIEAGASWSTAEGAGLTAAWTKRSATGRGDTLTASATFADLQQGVSADWALPAAFGYGRNLSANVSLSNDETDAFDRQQAIAGLALDIRHSDTLTFVLGASGELSRETIEDIERDLQVVSASASARLDRSNNLLDPTRGWRAEVKIEPGNVAGDAAANFVLTTGQFSYYQPLDKADRLVLAGRVRSGLVYGTDALDLPASRRFFAGGGGSARGYDYQAIGPTDDDGTPIGGRGLLEASGEVRWRQSDTLGWAAFIDGASVTSRDAPSFDDMRMSAGSACAIIPPLDRSAWILPHQLTHAAVTNRYRSISPSGRLSDGADGTLQNAARVETMAGGCPDGAHPTGIAGDFWAALGCHAADRACLGRAAG
jgi:translocation and assembly module TamA